MKLHLNLFLILVLSSSLATGQTSTISWTYEDNKQDNCCNDYPYLDILRMTISFEEESRNLTITIHTRGELVNISSIPRNAGEIDEISYGIAFDGPSTRLSVELYITESFQEAYYENQYVFHDYSIANYEIQFSIILPEDKAVLLNKNEAGFYHYKAFAKQSLTNNAIIDDSLVGSEVVNGPSQILFETNFLIFCFSLVIVVAYNQLSNYNIRETMRSMIEYRFRNKSNKF